MPRVPREGTGKIEKIKSGVRRKILMVLGVFEGPENDGAISLPKFGRFYKVNVY